MEFHKIYQRVLKVLESCETEKQLIIGQRYCHMLNDFYNSNYTEKYDEIKWIIVHFIRK